ncbi:hypothetical protein JG687_00015924 [Phytophthora cactorum]|uniref:Uncharacterized protein n=1 Tax=Phytophthora cactorum TaxID=29920 RepID=A0A8T1TVK3_9STRA|nr:hypothetical protein GQ600_7187 [Phytophthora cactorum]KAG6947727.1 hypothetical protein JG687_00015924 [Phytophthora cactorum]
MQVYIYTQWYATCTFMCFIMHSSCPASLTLRSTTCDWASQAWDAVTPETIRNCWKHSGKLCQCVAFSICDKFRLTQYIVHLCETL